MTIFTWSAIGEGYEGEYDPDDPLDVELLRLDRYEGDELVDSFCTHVPVATPEVEKQRLLALAAEAFKSGISMKILSWMEPKWTMYDVRNVNETVYGKAFAHYERALDHDPDLLANLYKEPEGGDN